MTDLTILMTLCNNKPERYGYFKRTVTAFKKHLVLTKYSIKWLVGLEPKFDINKNETETFCKENNILFYYNPGQSHLGTNQNYGLTQCDSKYIFFLQDDWECKNYINLDEDIDFLEAHGNIYVLRYWFRFIQTFDDYVDEKLKIKLLNPLTGFYYYGDNPHLKKATYHKITGPFYDKEDSRATENAMADRAGKLSLTHKICAKENNNYFEHIGGVSSIG